MTARKQPVYSISDREPIEQLKKTNDYVAQLINHNTREKQMTYIAQNHVRFMETVEPKNRAGETYAVIPFELYLWMKRTISNSLNLPVQKDNPNGD